jgi:enoyl-CoA hydratase/carnithine racemase
MTFIIGRFTITEPAEGYWRATYRNPPFNMLDPQTIVELQELISRIEANDDLRVIVFDSAVEGFFLGRYDLSGPAPAPQAPGPTGLPPFLDVTVRLSRASAISIASIRGRARGGGSELALACDLRFASLEKASLGQPEVGAGFLPGGGAIERLPSLVGRARALEILLSSIDYDAVTAERYGWINRAIPDSDLDDFVDSLARRLASFDPQPLREAKRLIRRGADIDADLFSETLTVLAQSLSWPSASKRRDLLRKRASQAGVDFELRLGYYLGPISLQQSPSRGGNLPE